MADSETTASRSVFGWLPKLILWGVVIAFGYLYLSSIDQQEGGSSVSLLEKIAQLSPIPISALPGSESKSVPVTESQVMASPVEQSPVAEHSGSMAPETPKALHETTQIQESQPVNDAESAVFAKSLMNTEPMTPPAAVPQKSVAQPQVPVLDQQTPRAVAPPPMPASVQSAPPAWAMPPRMAPENPSPSVRQAPYDWEAMERQQAQMRAEYAAMRREADERMRQYWEGMRSSAPVAGPYGYPGYPSGYGSGAAAPQR